MNNKLHLVSINKHAARVQMRELKEATTGMTILTQVWAVADAATPRPQACKALRDAVVDPEVGAHRAKAIPIEGDLAFYRKYTEGLLRRYLWLSMAGGRVASLLGRELFHGNVSNYSVQNYEEVAIFCVDIEKCLKRLTPMERALLKRIAVQQYSHNETAMMLGISLRASKRRYPQALDKLTQIFLKGKILEPLKSCQGGQEILIGVTQ